MCGGLLFIIRPNSILTQILLREIDNYGRWKIPKRGHRKLGFTTSSNASPVFHYFLLLKIRFWPKLTVNEIFCCQPHLWPS